ncbi:MAG: hypothetical protein CRN43_01430 [Candidatus Nephrothrix sp. EaCA]|nr:MAG: hypothetical protein CRN43_01430 [Candidatus Nephrothrix sp. EaCA]
MRNTGRFIYGVLVEKGKPISKKRPVKRSAKCARGRLNALAAGIRKVKNIPQLIRLFFMINSMPQPSLPDLTGYVPPPALDYCLQLWKEHPFVFKISKKRKTKAGDFVARPHSLPRITVNADLPPMQFLMTYIHEAAHLLVWLQKKRVKPHGAEWQLCYRRLMEPLLKEDIFPEPLLSRMKEHLNKPKASCYTDDELMKIFRQVETPHANPVYVSDLPIGSIFKLQNRWFQKGEVARTRAHCVEVKSKRKYVVSCGALVEEVQLSLF